MTESNPEQAETIERRRDVGVPLAGTRPVDEPNRVGWDLQATRPGLPTVRAGASPAPTAVARPMRCGCAIAAARGREGARECVMRKSGSQMDIQARSPRRIGSARRPTHGTGALRPAPETPERSETGLRASAEPRQRPRSGPAPARPARITPPKTPDTPAQTLRPRLHSKGKSGSFTP